MKKSTIMTRLVRKMKIRNEIIKSDLIQILDNIKFVCTEKINTLYIMRKITYFAAITNILLLFFFHVDSTKHFFKMVITVLTNEKFAQSISKIYTENIMIFKYLMYITLGVWVICKVIKNIWKLFHIFDSKGLNADKERLYQELFNYIYNNEKKCFVIDGEWGSGKTYVINNFIERFSKYNNKKIYRISCFGMENRSEILKELKNVFETQDNSFKKNVLNLINKTPLIGDFLEELLKSDYEFKDLEEGSIFIFDDFERINVPNYDMPENDLNILINHKKLDKYNIVVGLINELIEQYNMKVIVLLNKKEIDEDFFYNIFEYKMESYIFNLSHNRNILGDDIDEYSDEFTENDFDDVIIGDSIGDSISEELFNKYMKSNIRKLPVITVEKINTFLDKYKYVIDRIYLYSEENKRVLCKSIATFMELLEDEISLFRILPHRKFKDSINYIRVSDYKDIFFSILITNIYKYKRKNNKEDALEIFSVGDSMGEILMKMKLIYTAKGVSEEYWKKYEIIHIIIKLIQHPVFWCDSNLPDLWDKGNHNPFRTALNMALKEDKEKAETINNYIYKNIIPELEEENEYYFDDIIYILAKEYERNDKDYKNTEQQILKIMSEGNINLLEKRKVEFCDNIEKFIKDECTIYGIKDIELIKQIKDKIKSNKDINEQCEANAKVHSLL